MSSEEVPYSVSFRSNGTTYVLDRDGRRCLSFEGVTHADTIAILRFAGYKYQQLVRDDSKPHSYPAQR